MRILYLSQYFPPEVGATQSRAYDMAQSWVTLGHKVTILTEFPNHPSGIIPSEYKFKLFERAEEEGIQIIRLWIKTSPIKNFRSRLLFYLSYMFNAIIAGLFLVRGRFDFIYATSPPLFVGGAALVLNYLKRIPMVFEVRDLWPESAIALGELSNKRIISMALQFEQLCYRRAILTVVVTHGIYDRLIKRGISPDKLIVIPNGANIDMYKFEPVEREQIRKELGLERNFIAIYAGIHGIAQGLETILETAHLLRESSTIHFLFIGEGPKKTELLALKQKYNLTNLTFLPEKPREQIPGYLSAADVAIVPLRKVEIFNAVLPSKIFDAWACARPVLVSINGEARELVEGVKGGLYSPPEDSNKLADVLIHLMNSPNELKEMGKNGLDYTRQYHSRQILAEKLIVHLENYFNK